MTEFEEGTLVTCPLCSTKFTLMEDCGAHGEMCPNCDSPYTLAKELAELRAMQNLISFQKVFSDVSGLLLAFEEVTENMTVGEFLKWTMDELLKAEKDAGS